VMCRLRGEFEETRAAFEEHSATLEGRILELEELYRDRPSREEDLEKIR
jgi:hypothetical protein